MERRHVVGALVGALSFGCGGAPDPGRPTALPSVAKTATAVAIVATAVAAPGPARSYTRGPRAYPVIDEAGPFDEAVSISPDGLLVALHPVNSPALVFFDVDRKRIVGRSQSAGAALGRDAPTWIDDDHLLVSASGLEALFDGRNGSLRGEAANGVHVAIATKRGFATLVKDPFADKAELVLFTEPKRALARIAVDGYIQAAYGLGDGAFAYRGPRGLYAFEPDGRPRWQHAGELKDVVIDSKSGTARLVSRQGTVTLSLVDSHDRASDTAAPVDDAPRPRVAVRETGLFDPGASGPGAELLAFTRGRSVRLIEPANGVAFAARCENGSTATLGAVRSLPPAFSATPDADGAPQTLISKAGTHRVAWTASGVTLTEVATQKARTLDAGAPLAQVELHPNDGSLVTANNLRGLGMGWHPDPNASVRIFDLASGAQKKKLVGEGFRFSDDKTKLLVFGSHETSLYDAVSYQKLRSWKGVDVDVSLDGAARFAFVKSYERPAGGLGPHETKELFVEALSNKRRLFTLRGPDGAFAFDAGGSRFAFAPQAFPFDRDVRVVSVYDLATGKVSATIRVDEPLSRLAFLGDGKILAIWTRTGLVLHRLDDGRRATLHAVPDADKCRLFAVDDAGHVEGDPGSKLAFRYGDDLRTSEVAAAATEPARADERLLEKLFAGQ